MQWVHKASKHMLTASTMHSPKRDLIHQLLDSVYLNLTHAPMIQATMIQDCLHVTYYLMILSNGCCISWPAIRCLALYMSTSYRVLVIHTYLIRIIHFTIIEYNHHILFDLTSWCLNHFTNATQVFKPCLKFHQFWRLKTQKTSYYLFSWFINITGWVIAPQTHSLSPSFHLSPLSLLKIQ